MGQVNTTPNNTGSASRSDSGCALKRQSGNAPSYKDFEEQWRMCPCAHSRYFVRKIRRDDWTWHQYALNFGYVPGSVLRQEPLVLFTCKSQPQKPGRGGEKIDSKCRSIVKVLIKHRGSRGCSCDFEYIKTGHTASKSSNMCEKRSKRVLRAINKHDKICACSAFDFAIRPKTPSSTTSKESSTYAVASPDQVSDEDCDLFEGLPRKF
ncbi:hypothetical protein D6C76_03324 [Aureobasidium pullulans]|nr:hypothetical protein D6C76_03324 [Aureobasidium pullulans]